MLPYSFSAFNCKSYNPIAHSLVLDAGLSVRSAESKEQCAKLMLDAGLSARSAESMAQSVKGKDESLIR